MDIEWPSMPSMEWDAKAGAFAVLVGMIALLSVTKLEMWDTVPFWYKIATPLLAVPTTYVIALVALNK